MKYPLPLFFQKNADVLGVDMFFFFLIASAHFIGALSWLYCSQCRYAPLLRIAIFVIVCLLHFVLWDRTVPIG